METNFKETASKFDFEDIYNLVETYGEEEDYTEKVAQLTQSVTGTSFILTVLDRDTTAIQVYSVDFANPAVLSEFNNRYNSAAEGGTDFNSEFDLRWSCLIETITPFCILNTVLTPEY